MLRAIFFDIDNTLFPTAKFAEIARRNAIRALVAAGVPYDEDTLFMRLQDIIKKYGPNYPNHFDRLLESFKIFPSPKYVAAAVAAYHNTKSQLAPYPGAQRTLLALHEKGLGLYVVSQGNPVKQWDKLYLLDIAYLFDDVFVTEKEKSPLLFKKILKELKLKPKEALMVGDRADGDILPAKDAGLVTVHLTRGPYGKHPCKKSDFHIRDLQELIKLASKL